ncbi:MAG: pitrilysin family protein [Crocinitomicaceae bacterium]|nr:pitrilysin family protein [Crocinitomicaceae bacterium]
MIEVEPTIVTLSNGIRLVYLPTTSQVSHMGVTILAGSRYEESNEEGLAHFLEHCIFKGTEKRRSLHILSRLDSVGGELNAFTTKEEICVYASFTTEHLKRASELLADIVLRSNFPSKEIEKEKDIVLDEINSYLDSPGDRIFDDFESLIFKNHSLGTNILGTKDSVTAFGKDDLLAYTKRFFFAENMVVSFVGDVPIQKLIRRLESDFGSLQHSAKMVQPKGFSGYEPFKIRSKEANFQSHVMVGSIAPGYDSEDRRSMTLLTNILGGPALNSRLILSIREKYGYSYNIEASFSPFADTGYWSIYFGTDQKYIDKTLKLVYKELKLMREQALTQTQLKKAKEQLRGHLALSFDSNSGLMLGLGKSLLLFNQIDSVQEIYQAIEDLKSSDLQEVANKYFDEKGISELIYEQVNE